MFLPVQSHIPVGILLQLMRLQCQVREWLPGWGIQESWEFWPRKPQPGSDKVYSAALSSIFIYGFICGFMAFRVCGKEWAAAYRQEQVCGGELKRARQSSKEW